MSARSALITGISGQDGSYLAEFLLAKGYRVHGLVRRPVTETFPHLADIRDRLQLFQVNLVDPAAVARVLRETQSDEIYNLAAQTYVPASWQDPLQALEATGLSVACLLESIRQHCPKARLFQAGSSEMFGTVSESPQSETTPFHPRSPYGAAKVYGQHLVACYREHHGIFACGGILYNHESPRRGPEFVTRKISQGVARIKLGLDTELRLGNLQAQRDWGYAGDFARAIWLVLQRDDPDDYVIGTGRAQSVEDFVRIAFDHVGLDWRRHVVVDPQFYRPLDKELLLANPGKARAKLGWQPELSFTDLVIRMVDADLASLRRTHRATARVAC